jgi:hypothetical protein
VAPNAYLFLREAQRLPPEGVLDAANIGLLAFRPPAIAAEAIARGYRNLWGDDTFLVLARATEPRYYFSSQYRVMAPAQALEALAEGRAARELLLEAKPSFPSSPNLVDDPVVASQVLRNDVVLRLRAPREGLVYCSESQAAGWHARVNGRAAPIVSANYAFRAIPVPAGDVVVELHYFPPGLATGLMLSAVALIGMAWFAFRREASPLAILVDRVPPRDGTRVRRLVLGAAGVLIVGFLASDLATRLPALRRSWESASTTRERGDSFYRVQWKGVRLPSELPAGKTIHVEVAFRNIGTDTWPDVVTGDPVRRDGTGAVRLSYRFWRADVDQTVTEYTTRFDLPKSLGSQKELVLPVDVQLPAEPGRYRLQVDLVHELVSWFEQRGAEKLLVPLTVGPEPVTGQPPADTPRRAVPIISPP